MAQNTGQTLFETYEKSYCSAATSVSEGLSSLSTLPLGERSSRAKSLEKDVKDAEQILQRLDMEARSASPEQSRSLLQKVKDYRTDLNKLKEDLKRVGSGVKVTPGAQLARAELGLSSDYYQTSAGQRERLLSATERLEKTSERIQQGRQQLLETEAIGSTILGDLRTQRESLERSQAQVQDLDGSISKANTELGVSVLSDLQRQRESILHSRDTLGTVDSNIGKAREVLSVMSRRIMQKKVIMWGVIALLVGAIGLIVWSKLS